MASDTTTKQVDVKVGTPGAAQAQRQLSGLAGALKDLNNSVKGSGLGGEGSIFSLLKGGGAALGIKFAAEGVTRVIDVYQKYKAGSLDARDATLEFAKSIPILGSVFEATLSVMDLITGRAEEYANAMKEAKKAQKDWAAQQAVTEIFEKAGTFAHGLTHPEEKTPIAELMRGRKAIDDRYALIREHEHIRREQARLQANPELYANEQARQEKLEWFGREMERTHTSAATKTALEAANKENAAALMDQLKEVAQKAGGVFKTEFVPAFKFISDQFWKDMDKAEREEYRKDFMYQMQQDTIEFQRIKQQELEEFEAEQKARVLPGMVSRYAPGVEGRFLTGAAPGGGNTPEAQTAKNTAETNKKLDENTAAIKDLARAINQNPGQVIYIR